MRKLFAAKINEEVLQAFRLKCDAQGYPIGNAIEALMTEFAGRVDNADFIEAVRAVKTARKPKEKVIENESEAVNATVVG